MSTQKGKLQPPTISLLQMFEALLSYGSLLVDYQREHFVKCISEELKKSKTRYKLKND